MSHAVASDPFHQKKREILSRYPASPSSEQLVDILTEISFYDVYFHPEQQGLNFNWDFRMPRIARRNVKAQLAMARRALPLHFHEQVNRRLAALYSKHGIFFKDAEASLA